MAAAKKVAFTIGSRMLRCPFTYDAASAAFRLFARRMRSEEYFDDH